MDLKKTEDLSESIINVRTNYPRAYEPWSEKEEELLRKAMEYTNNLELLTKCFQRGRGSIESKGKRIKYQIKIEAEAEEGFTTSPQNI